MREVVAMSAPKFPSAWLVDRFLDWIAKRRGTPTVGETDQEIEGNLEFISFRDRYSPTAWQKILETNPDFRRLVDKLVSKSPVGYRNALDAVLKWIHDNEARLSMP